MMNITYNCYCLSPKLDAYSFSKYLLRILMSWFSFCIIMLKHEEVFKFSMWLKLFFPLWLYSPILGLGRHHETFRFISVFRSRTVGRTPWTGDQLVTRPLLTAPGDCEDTEVGGMNGFLAGEAEVLGENLPWRYMVHHKSHLPGPGTNPGLRGGKPATDRFSYGTAVITFIWKQNYIVHLIEWVSFCNIFWKLLAQNQSS
jgi:hypothetical protein